MKGVLVVPVTINGFSNGGKVEMRGVYLFCNKNSVLAAYK